MSATSSALFSTTTAEMWKRLGLQLPNSASEAPNSENYETVNDDISAAKQRAAAASAAAVDQQQQHQRYADRHQMLQNGISVSQQQQLQQQRGGVQSSNRLSCHVTSMPSPRRPSANNNANGYAKQSRPASMYPPLTTAQQVEVSIMQTVNCVIQPSSLSLSIPVTSMLLSLIISNLQALQSGSQSRLVSVNLKIVFRYNFCQSRHHLHFSGIATRPSISVGQSSSRSFLAFFRSAVDGNFAVINFAHHLAHESGPKYLRHRGIW